MFSYSWNALPVHVCRTVDITDFTALYNSWLGPGSSGFTSYTQDVSLVFERHIIKHHLVAADDKQAYSSAPLQGADDVMRDRLHDCTADISNWCASRRLQLIENKRSSSGLASVIDRFSSIV